MSAFNMGLYGTRMFVIMLMALSMLMIIIINQLVSARIAKPLQRLNQSVREWEAGNLNPTIYIGGSLEVEHLGKTLRSTVEQINRAQMPVLGALGRAEACDPYFGHTGCGGRFFPYREAAGPGPGYADAHPESPFAV